VQVPKNYVSAEVCEILSDHLIASSELCGHLISVAAFGLQFVGHPEYIRDERYERNQFMYNVCFVFDAQTDVSAYRPLIRCFLYVSFYCMSPAHLLVALYRRLLFFSICKVTTLSAGVWRDSKVAMDFRTIEINHRFLSARETRGRIEEIIAGILDDILRTGV